MKLFHIQKQPLDSNRSSNIGISYHDDIILVQRSKILFWNFKIERNCFASEVKWTLNRSQETTQCFFCNTLWLQIVSVLHFIGHFHARILTTMEVNRYHIISYIIQMYDVVKFNGRWTLFQHKKQTHKRPNISIQTHPRKRRGSVPPWLLKTQKMKHNCCWLVHI